MEDICAEKVKLVYGNQEELSGGEGWALKKSPP